MADEHTQQHPHMKPAARPICRQSCTASAASASIKYAADILATGAATLAKLQSNMSVCNGPISGSAGLQCERQEALAIVPFVVVPVWRRPLAVIPNLVQFLATGSTTGPVRASRLQLPCPQTSQAPAATARGWLVAPRRSAPCGPARGRSCERRRRTPDERRRSTPARLVRPTEPSPGSSIRVAPAAASPAGMALPHAAPSSLAR